MYEDFDLDSQYEDRYDDPNDREPMPWQEDPYEDEDYEDEE